MTLLKNRTPILVGLVRGAAGAVILALLGVVIVQVGDVHAGTLTPYIPVAVLALRTLEAWVLDQRTGGSGPAGGS